MNLKKVLNLFLMITLCISSMLGQNVTSETHDAAYDAPASKLYGTWICTSRNNIFVDQGDEWTFKPNGILEVRYLSDRQLTEGLRFYLSIKYNWTKKKDILTIKPIPGSKFSITLTPESKEKYQTLSNRLKKDVDEDIDYFKRELEGYSSNQICTIYLIDEQYLVIENDNKAIAQPTAIFINKKYLEEKQKADAEAAKIKQDQEINSLISLLPKDVLSKIKEGKITATDALSNTTAVVIPEEITSLPIFFGQYFSSLDTLIVKGNLASIPELKKPLRLLELNSYETSFRERTAEDINYKGVWLVHVSGYSSEKLFVKATCKDENTVVTAIGYGISHPYVLVLTPYNHSVCCFPEFSSGFPMGYHEESYRSYLRGVIITPTNEWYNIKRKSFMNCLNLKLVEFSQNLNTIGYSAFQNCGNLNWIQFVDDINCIGQNSFNKTGLRGLIIPSSTKELVQGCFSNCNNLVVALIDGTYSEIKKTFFNDCNKLTGVAIGDSIEKIEKESFPTVKAVYFSRNIPPKIDGKSFNKEAVAFVPQNALTDYQKAYGKFFTQIIGVENDEDGVNKVIEIVRQFHKF